MTFTVGQPFVSHVLRHESVDRGTSPEEPFTAAGKWDAGNPFEYGGKVSQTALDLALDLAGKNPHMIGDAATLL